MLSTVSPSYSYLATSSTTVINSSSAYWEDDLQFKRLYRSWLDQTRYASSPRVMTASPSFRAIVQMGFAAVPLIIIELRKRPSFIVLALEEITHTCPIADNHRGDLRAMTEDWIRWYQNRK